MNKKPPTIRSIDESSLHRIRARSKGKPTFADCYPDRKALGCLNPGAETLQLNEVLPGSKVYFRWICNKNSAHQWDGTAGNRTRYHCPHCYAEEKSEKIRRGKTNPENLLKDKFPEHFAQLEVVLDSKGRELDKNYLGAKSFEKGIWNIGCGCGPFVARISDRTCGTPSQGCISCANAKIGKRTRERSLKKYGRLSETHETLAAEWVAPYREDRKHIGLTPETVSSTSGEKVLWRCSNLAPSGLPCGWEFPAIVADRALGNHNCPSCANRDTRGQSKRRRAVDVHGSVKDHPRLGPEFRRIVDSRYSHLTSADISIESNYSCEWKCSIHSKKFFVTSPSARFRYESGELRISGCGSCSEEKKRAWGYTQGLDRSGVLAEKFPKLAQAWIDCPNAPNQTPYNTSCGSRLIVNWRCLNKPAHPSWRATVCDRKNGVGCPTCNSSKGELLISKELTRLEVSFVPQLTVKRLLKLRGPTSIEISSIQSYDFAIFNGTEELIALIEYHGIQHYEPVNFGNKDRDEDEIQKSFEKTCERDKKKSALASDLNIPLLVIPYWKQKEIHELLDVFLGSSLKLKQ